MPNEEIDCAVKHCGSATLGMTIRFGDLRVEVFLCELHFDQLDAWLRGHPDFLPPEVWERAIDPSCPPGVVKIDGQPYPLVEFGDIEEVDQ